MKFRFALTLLAVAAVAFTGCDKIKKALHLMHKDAVVASTPTPTPQPAMPTPSPSPTATPKVAANHNAGVIVLCYHRFEDINNAMVLKPADFEKQMQAIKDNGFTVISMQDFLAWRRDEKEIPVKSCLITIDDGYVSGYENAWPILKKYGYPFTVFVYINYIDRGGKSITWDQLAEMRDAGVEIGCHSYTHQNLKGRSSKSAADIKQLTYEGWLRKEIIEPKKILEDHLGIKVSTYAYPEGVYNEEVRKVIKEAGFEAAFNTYGQRNAFSSPASDIIGRYAIEAGKPKTFEVAMAMIGGGMGPSTAMTASAPSISQAPASNLETTPAQGATVSEAKPLIKAVLASLGAVEPDSVQMRVSGFGPVPAKYDNATKTVSFQFTQPLRDKDYTVIVSAKVGGKKSESRWSFKFDPAAAKQ
jgi:peptidoglycan/xylan/chitin deacetylase (PgdA/CDA1 family)